MEPSQSKQTPQSKLSRDALIKLAEQAFEQFSPGIAAKYYEEAIKQEPHNALLHHKLALMYVDYGEPEQAHKSFLKSIELSPNDNESNYLYIGQQCHGHSAKSAFEKGIQLMKLKLAKLDSDTDSDKLRSDLKYEISSAYVSIAELYMTDMCESSDAQMKCEKYLNLSLQFDNNNIETFVTFAEFKHCQQKHTNAIKYFKIALQKLFVNKVSIDNENETKMDQNTLDIFNEKSLSMDSFLKIVKLGIELEQFEACLIILKNLVNANDAIGECWALGTLCLYKLGNVKDAAIWLANAESILMMESTNTLNAALKETLETIKSEMNLNELPDLKKLSISDHNNDVNAFLQESDQDIDILKNDNGNDMIDVD